MKIISLQADNIKRLAAVEITPQGNLVQITGANGQGKTSVLDSIWWALQGVKNIQKNPIRDGEEKAQIRLDLGEYVVTRRFIAQEDGTFTTSLTVEDSRVDGARLSSPQKVLDSLLGELTFDPLEFTRMGPKDQAHALQSLVPDFDFAESERIAKAAFDDRTFENRKAKEARAAVESLSKGLPDVRPEPVSVSQLNDDWQAAMRHNQDVENRANNREGYTIKRNELAADIEDKRAKLNEMVASLEQMDAKISEWGELAEPIDVSANAEKLNRAQEINAMAKRFEDVDEKRKECETATANADKLSEVIKDAQNSANAAISGASMPVDGLGIENGVVTLDGLPFEQASDAQQLRASIAIAMALNPRLRVIRVRDGSRLDSAAMASLAEMLNETDYQVWIERVDDSGSVGFVMENGRVKETKAPAAGGLFCSDLE